MTVAERLLLTVAVSAVTATAVTFARLWLRDLLRGD